ncbi:hypothetical protein ACFQZC_30480 [Streptacidiphilus monticola]
MHGDDLYRLRTHGNLPATYPAFAALLFTPSPSSRSASSGSP